jgi:hypothetical protein
LMRITPLPQKTTAGGNSPAVCTLLF